jgi:hypothetical protein
VYSSMVLAISLILAASAFAQPQKFREHNDVETGDVSRTVTMDDSTTDPPDDSVTDPTEDPPEDSTTAPTVDTSEDTSEAPPPSDSVFASMSDDACPGVLNPVVVESFRVMAPTLVQRCEALQDVPPTSSPTTASDPSTPPMDPSTPPIDPSILSSDPGTVPEVEGIPIDANQP